MDGCSHDNVLPELQLTAAHRKLLAERNDPPRTAVDYYLSLPVSFFGNVEDTTPERRVSFIEMETLSDQWLKAGHFFECDGGGFEVVMRVFDTADGPLIAIDQWGERWKTIYEKENTPRGEVSSITLGVPSFWRYSAGDWVEAEGVSLPGIDEARVIDRYRNHFKAHLNLPDQPKYIWLQYELPKTGKEIRLIGRENFMEPDGDYVWQRLRFDGHGFTELPLTD